MTAMLKGMRAYRAHSYSTLESVAARVRALFFPGLSDVTALPGRDLFDKLDEQAVSVRGTTVRLQCGVEPLPQGLQGLTYHSVEDEEIVVVLTTETYRQLCAGGARALFTVGHEVGHAFLHPAELVDLARVGARPGVLRKGEVESHRTYMDTEWQANGFAGALLMPACGLLKIKAAGSLDARTVASTYGVSRQAAERRVKILAEQGNKLAA